MTIENDAVGLSPTVAQVIDHFLTAMRADDAVKVLAIDRLEKVMKAGVVPKPEEINALLFNPPT